MGCSDEILPVLLRLFGMSVAVLAIVLLGRSGIGKDRRMSIGAWLLAASPIWIEGSLSGDPFLMVGLTFLLLSRPGVPVWLGAILLGWMLGWAPWAWVTVLLLPLGGLLCPRARGIRAVGIVPLALLVLWVLNPPALLDAARWLTGMLWRVQTSGMGWTAPGLAAAQGLWPLTGSLHVPALILLLVAARNWPGRLRRGDAAPLAFLVAVLFCVGSGRVGTAPLLILLPWVVAEVGGVAGEWLRRLTARPGASRHLGRVLPVVLLIPLLWTFAGRCAQPAGGEREQAAAAAWVEGNLEPGSLVAYEIGFEPPDSSACQWLAIPFYSVDPAVRRGAYWIGWYGSFRAAVVREQRLVRFLREPERYSEILRFYLALKNGAQREMVFGETPGRRVRVLLFPPDAAPTLGVGWRERLAGGRATGLQGGFLAGLGGVLAQSGRPGAAVELLEEARTAGYDEPGIYVNLANAHLGLGRTFEAGRVLDEGVERHPESPILLHNLGLALMRVQLWDRAAQTFARLRTIWPRSAEVCYLLGFSLVKRGDLDAGWGYLEEALRLDPDLPQRETALELLDFLRGTRR
jgi:tetratricopeptide (TPR) repeat protein